VENPGAGTNINSKIVCIVSVLPKIVSGLVNNTYSSEFKITENSECTEEPQHVPDDTESPEEPANIIDEEYEEIPPPHLQPERGQSRKYMANRKHRCRIGMKTKHSSSKWSCILCFARIN
jgi:hypothetical protein